jgi:type II secretory pathway pseudopilin PulG
MIIAVALLAVLGVTALSLSRLMMREAAYTRQTVDQAQVRQLLLAGAAAAQAHAGPHAPADQPVPLPEALTGCSVQVTLLEVTDEESLYQITVSWRDHQQHQTLRVPHRR